jgi:hypothetical protein
MHDGDQPSPDAIRRKADELEAEGQHETALIMRRVADDIEAQEGAPERTGEE